MNIQGFELVNDEKIERAQHGTITRGGVLTGGLDQLVREGKLSREDNEAYETALLAEYDRLGGLVMKNGVKVKTGSFWDIKLKVMRPEPQLSYMIEVEEEIMEVDEEEALALKAAKEKVKKLKEKKSKKQKEEEVE